MDINEIMENLNNETNEDTRVNWWDYGLKRITGERIVIGKAHFDNEVGCYVLDDGAYNPTPLTLKIYSSVDFGNGLTDGNQLLAIFNSGTYFKIKQSAIPLGSGSRMNYAEGLPYIYDMPSISSLSWLSESSTDNVSTYGATFEHKDFNKGVFDNKLDITTHSYGAVKCPPFRGSSPIGYFQDIITHARQYHPTRELYLANWYHAIGTSFIDDNYNLFLIDDGTQLRLMHKFDGIYELVGSSQVRGIFHEGTYYAYSIAEIPYSVLNDTDFFNPLEDGFDTEPKEPTSEEDDPSGTGGGTPQYNYPQDPIGFPSLPQTGAIDSGFLTMYCPTSTQLQALVDYLWTSDWIDTIKKMINNPMDAIISLSICPIHLSTYTTSTLKIGAISTGISCNKVNNQYMVLDCGTVQVPLKFASMLDYSPYTKCEIYLPFIGTRTIDIDIIMDASITLKYYVDLLTGSCVAMLACSKKDSTNSIYYHYDGNINYQIPITGANYSQVITGLVNATASVIGTTSSIASGGGIGLGLTQVGSIVSGASSVVGGKHSIESHGSLSSNTGILSNYEPYIIIEQPKPSNPSSFKADKGYMSNISATLSSLSGYTEVEYIHLDGIVCTESERIEIDNILKSGVIL